MDTVMTGSIRAPRGSAPKHVVPEPQELAEGIWALAYEMPETGLPYSLGYVLEDAAGGVHIIDSGWPNEANWARLSRQLRRIGRSIDDIATVAATHLHPDHLGMHNLIRNRSGAALLMHRREDAAALHLQGTSALLEAFERWDEWGVPERHRIAPPSHESYAGAPFHQPADRHLSDGEPLPVPGRQIWTISTPGHTAGHVTFADRDAGILFTGDHLMPTRHAGLRLGGEHAGNPVAEYIASLRRVATLDARLAAPGHEHPFVDIRERTLSSAEHHLRRSREVAAALDASPDASVWHIAHLVSWRNGIESLTGFYFVSALAQTALHMDYVKSGGDTSRADW